ncbi:PfkB family carbohydrate kinase [Kosmotoga pacifica]|uniref:PfkB family carbohydrate kinase n=1 Tax=Kosmotoga pacifica TaxID=1330330 RepID=UPI00069A9ADC|nr:PfkB family carbohydrate kinase [Kosmotoga pacifica]
MKIKVFGGTFWDVFIYGEEPHKAEIFEMPGGSGLNIAFGLFRQGFDVQFYSNIGEDWRGEEIKKALKKEGFNTVGIRVIANMKTGHHIAFNDRPIAVDRGANREPIILQEDPEADVVFINTEIPEESIFEALRIPSKLVIVDLGPRKIVSSEQLRAVCQTELLLLGTERECDGGCDVVKLGAKGAWVRGKHIPADTHVYPYTVGAGDIFDVVFTTLYLKTGDILFSTRAAVETSQTMVREVKGAFSKAQRLDKLI